MCFIVLRDIHATIRQKQKLLWRNKGIGDEWYVVM